MPDTPDRPTWRSEAALLFVVMVWGINFPIVKAVLEIMHPHVLNTFRFIVSATVLGSLYALHRRRLGKPLFEPLRRRAREIAGLGILGFLFYQFCFIVGIDFTTAGNAALIMATAPLWTAVTGYVFGLETLPRSSWAALMIVLAGSVVIVLGGSNGVHFGSNTFIGNLIMLAAAVFWGSYTALSKPMLSYVSPTGLTFLSLLFALPFLFGLGIPYYGETRWADIRWIHWAAILFSGGLSTGLTIAIWNNAIDRVGASNTAVYGNLVPLIALGSSFWLLGEPVRLAQIVGGLMVIVGLLLMRRARGTPPRLG